MLGRFLVALLAPLALAGTVAAGPIAVFTQVWEAAGNSAGEISVAGLGNWAVLTWGSGPGPVVTVPADQTTATQAVVGFWPVLGFRDRAQYDAQRGTVVTVPDTPVTLYAEVWNGEYGRNGTEVQRVFVNATVAARVGADAGQNAVDWTFADPPTQVRFADDTVVTLGYRPVRMAHGVPQIQFEDGSPAIGFPGPTYYPTLVEAEVGVTRPLIDPGPGGPTGPGGNVPPGEDVPGAPEPSGALLLVGFLLGGSVARYATRRRNSAP
jgi:hypothetical protein